MNGKYESPLFSQDDRSDNGRDGGEWLATDRQRAKP